MARPTNFEIKQSGDGAAARLAVLGELDMRTTEQLSASVDEQLTRGATELTIDLSQLAFMDSSGLRLLIDLHDRARAEDWRLRLVAPEDEAAALVLRVTGADQALPFTQTRGS